MIISLRKSHIKTKILLDILFNLIMVILDPNMIFVVISC